MVDFNSISKTTSSEQKEKPVKASMVRRNEEGHLEIVFLSQEKASRLSKVESRDSYFDAIFKRGQSQEDPLRRAFFRAFSQVKCFHCEDKGFVNLLHNTPLGKPYMFAYQCNCQLTEEKPFGKDITENINSLIRQGLHTPFCQLGGEDGTLCQLTIKDQKCLRFNCTKFGKGMSK